MSFINQTISMKIKSKKIKKCNDKSSGLPQLHLNTHPEDDRNPTTKYKGMNDEDSEYIYIIL